jgi:hypothetical protein
LRHVNKSAYLGAQQRVWELVHHEAPLCERCILGHESVLENRCILGQKKERLIVGVLWDCRIKIWKDRSKNKTDWKKPIKEVTVRTTM